MEQQEQQLMKLEGTVEHVIYENADSGYAVFEVDAGGTDVRPSPATSAGWTTA